MPKLEAVSTEKLKEVVDKVAEFMERNAADSPQGFQKLFDVANEMLAPLGILPGMHAGQGESMKSGDEQACRMLIEWYAGQLLDITETLGKIDKYNDPEGILFRGVVYLSRMLDYSDELMRGEKAPL